MTPIEQPRPMRRERRAIFILGMQRRTGTNYLCDLVHLHPQAARLPNIAEDFLVAKAHHLDDYVRAVSESWHQKWNPDGAATQLLRDAIGSSIVDFLHAKARGTRRWLPPYVVTKSPTVENLHLVAMFPRSSTLVIVRDGRAVVESGMRSFGWDFDTSATRWAASADTVIQAREAGLPFLLVRYEDVLSDLRGELLRVFEHVGLDPARYDFDAAATQRIRGSSELREQAGTMHWTPVERWEGFNPLERFADWTPERHSRFNELAGAQLTALGYEPAPVEPVV